jgi:hypothetical protein
MTKNVTIALLLAALVWLAADYQRLRVRLRSESAYFGSGAAQFQFWSGPNTLNDRETWHRVYVWVVEDKDQTLTFPTGQEP